MSKKYFEKRWYFTDGILIAELIGRKNKDFYGVDITTRFRNIIIGHASYAAAEFGTYGNAKQYALQSLKNSHFKKIDGPVSDVKKEEKTHTQAKTNNPT